MYAQDKKISDKGQFGPLRMHGIGEYPKKGRFGAVVNEQERT